MDELSFLFSKESAGLILVLLRAKQRILVELAYLGNRANGPNARKTP